MAGEDEEECYFDAEASRRELALAMQDDSRTLQRDERFQPPVRPPTTRSELPRPRTSEGLPSRKALHRRSLQEAIPAIPAIPEKFLRLENGRPASIGGITALTPTPSNSDRERNRVGRGANITPDLALRVNTQHQVRSESVANTKRALLPRDSHTPTPHNNGVKRAQEEGEILDSSVLLSPASARRKSLPALSPRHRKHNLAAYETSESTDRRRSMSRHGRGREQDLFLELANDGEEDEVRPPSRSERVASRLSQSGKRRSLPAEVALTSSAERRPKSSGNVFPRPSSRLSGLPSDLQRHVDRYRDSPSRAGFQRDDSVSVSGRSASGLAHRYSAVPERGNMGRTLTERMRSPELPSFGRRRPSFGGTPPQPYKGRQSQLSGKAQDSQDESPAESSEPKRSLPDSASVDSDTADTVWDELDDLKSRIKKLELTGKLPPSSSAAVASGDSSERPRTATTAPTTIDSSPKHERKPEPEAQKEGKKEPAEPAVGGPNAANIHPTLHAALAKAKPLINGTLYRSLEATAADALQLAAMTGGAGPQGTAFSAASIINGATVSDRHIRRKADTMCRNLTDLTLALCEGKHEAPSITASPITLEPVRSSPTIRYSRSSIGPGDNIGRAGSRPVSRLEARRTSILGVPPTGSVSGNSAYESNGEVSASEQDGTPSHSQPPRELRRVGRASSRLLSVRPNRYDDVSGDEDPTIRPPSRAMTDIGGHRTKPSGPREYHSPGQSGSPSLRETLVTRRANSGAFENNRELSRVASLNSDVGRRRWMKESTPPVVEEEAGDDGEHYQPSSQPRRRITSLGQFSARRATELPNRAVSLSSRRPQAVME